MFSTFLRSPTHTTAHHRGDYRHARFEFTTTFHLTWLSLPLSPLFHSCLCILRSAVLFFSIHLFFSVSGKWNPPLRNCLNSEEITGILHFLNPPVFFFLSASHPLPSFCFFFFCLFFFCFRLIVNMSPHRNNITLQSHPRPNTETLHVSL